MTLDDEMPTRRSSPTLMWGTAFLVGMIGTGVLARYFDLSAGWSMAVMVLPMLLLLPFVRSIEKKQAAFGGVSKAMRNYNRRVVGASFLYMISLFAAIWSWKEFQPTGAAAWLLAIAPALPLIFMIWAMGRYLAEEEDEYMRMRTVNAALWATGLLLAVSTIWGFLEQFLLVPHIPAWTAFALWSVGLGIGHFMNKVRGI